MPALRIAGPSRYPVSRYHEGDEGKSPYQFRLDAEPVCYCSRSLFFTLVSGLLTSSSAIDAQCGQMSSLFGLPSC